MTPNSCGLTDKKRVVKAVTKENDDDRSVRMGHIASMVWVLRRCLNLSG